jgi:hypothetical protein
MGSSVAAACLGAADGATTTAAGEIETTAVSEVTVDSGAVAVMEAETAAAETAE